MFISILRYILFHVFLFIYLFIFLLSVSFAEIKGECHPYSKFSSVIKGKREIVFHERYERYERILEKYKEFLKNYHE
ncbi:hypothetical protein PGB90_003284 [Kerria lacca]